MDYYTLLKQARFVADKVKGLRLEKAYSGPAGLCLKLGRFWLNFILDPDLSSFFLSSSPFFREKGRFSDLLMLLAKSGRITNFRWEEGERVYILSLERREVSGVRAFELVFEVLGRRANLVLLENGKIIDSVHRDFSDFGRSFVPGRFYVLPDPGGKKLLWSADRDEVLEVVNRFGLSGLSKFYRPVPRILVSELRTRFGKERPESPSDLIELWSIFEKLKEELFSPFLYVGKNRVLPFCAEEFVPRPANDALSAFVEKKLSEKRLSSLKSELRRIVKRELKKIEQLESEQVEIIKKAEKKDLYRVWAEAVLINLNRIDPQSEKIFLPNPYNESEILEIPFPKGKKPSLFAEELFSKSSKLKKAEEVARKRFEALREERSFLEDILWQIEEATEELELFEIKDLLEEQGYMKKQASSRPKESLPKRYRTYRLDGILIFVGKNAKGNDEVTFRLSSREDFWFHAKNVPGAHVVARAKELTPEQIAKIASIAAFFSKVRSSSKAEVDYTRVKFVKRAKSKKPGMVVYRNFSSVLVKPEMPEGVENAEED